MNKPTSLYTLQPFLCRTSIWWVSYLVLLSRTTTTGPRNGENGLINTFPSLLTRLSDLGSRSPSLGVRTRRQGTTGWHCIGDTLQGLGIYDVKGSVSVPFCKLQSREERGRKGRRCKLLKKSTLNLWHHKYLDPCRYEKEYDLSKLTRCIDGS